MASSCWEKLVLRPVADSAAHVQSAIPVFVYGTAWKKDQTADLVHQALSNGFTGVDTAAQPKHYREDLVGVGIRRALAAGTVKRENLYLQTKYTSVNGQDPNAMPYDPKKSITEQVQSSVRSSLHNLRPSEESGADDQTYIDTLVLHSPLPTFAQTMEAWTACEQYVPNKIHNLGISNCPLPVLKELYQAARIKPAVVQNRFYPDTRYDVSLRRFCREHSIIYQSFWTLTANPQLAQSNVVGTLAARLGISRPAALYCLVLSLQGTVLLNGTKTESHMITDLEAPKQVEAFTISHPKDWEIIQQGFKRLIGESASDS